MKILNRILGGIFFLLPIVSQAQDTAPTSLAGKSGIVVISGGSGAFANVGGYRITFTSTTYTIAPLSSQVNPGAGTYSYSKVNANTAAIAINDTNTGLSASQALVFSSASTASFNISSAVGSQQGTFVLEGVTATTPPPTTVLAGLSNMSVRAAVPANGQIIPGIVLDQPCRVLVRVAGPALAAFGVPGTLPNPKVFLYSGQNVVASNDDWSSTPTNQTAVQSAVTKSGAFAFTAGSKDAALVADLAAGSYTCVIVGDTGTTGEVLLEVYRVPN